MAAAATSVAWYVALGAAHEASHVAAAALVGRLRGAGDVVNILRALFGRHVYLPALSAPDCPAWQVAVVRHFAWGVSVVLAIAAYVGTRTKRAGGDAKNDRSDAAAAMVLAALVTALEAVATDLAGWGPGEIVSRATPPSFLPGGGGGGDGEESAIRASLFFCGNFGEDRIITASRRTQQSVTLLPSQRLPPTRTCGQPLQKRN